MWKTLLGIVIMVSVVSCHSNTAKVTGNVIYVGVSEKADRYLPLSIAVSEIESVKLSLPLPHFWGIVSEVIAWGDNYFLVDKKQSVAFRFTKGGTFLNTIGRRGQGPGEYIEMSSFFVSDSCAYVCDLMSRSIHKYAWDGEYLATIHFPYSIVFDDVIALSDDCFLCHRLADDENGKGLWVMNSEGKIVKRLLEYKQGTPYVYSDWNTLSMGEDGIARIYNPMSGRFYELDADNGSITEALCLRADRNMMDDLISPTGKEIQEGTRECAYSLFAVNGDHYVLSFWSLTPENKVLWSIVRKKDKTVYKGVLPRLDIPGYTRMGRPVSSNIPNALVTLYTDEFTPDMLPNAYKNYVVDEQKAVLSILKLK